MTRKGKDVAAGGKGKRMYKQVQHAKKPNMVLRLKHNAQVQPLCDRF